jgi:hypothetical protein
VYPDELCPGEDATNAAFIDEVKKIATNWTLSVYFLTNLSASNSPIYLPESSRRMVKKLTLQRTVN